MKNRINSEIEYCWNLHDITSFREQIDVNDYNTEYIMSLNTMATDSINKVGLLLLGCLNYINTNENTSEEERINQSIRRNELKKEALDLISFYTYLIDYNSSLISKYALETSDLEEDIFFKAITNDALNKRLHI